EIEAVFGAPVAEPGHPEAAVRAAIEMRARLESWNARRVAAGLADLLILALVGAVELAAGALLLDLRFPPPAFVPLAAFLFLAALVLLVLAPFVWGTTPGMALADLRIRARDGGSPTLAAAFRRFLGFLLTGALAGVPLLVAAFDRRGRTLADLLSGTTIEGVEALEPAGQS
ncbi:MAG TPA: RDD family protein, partial [Thermoanaerobaculia bacterium]|nr:RDD family protein [Thermoanaerobaculia bacterium]